MLTLLLGSLLPFGVFLFLLLIQKKSLLFTSVTTVILTLVLTIAFWQILPLYAAASLVKGLLTALDIFLIIFGAIFFLEILKDTHIIESLCFELESFSKDYRIQVIILAWFLENFLEGTAGFGTPAAVVVPILVGLGLSPINAVILGLIGNSAAGVFGAAGTPIRTGFAGLDIASVPGHAAWINCLGLLVPVFMLWSLVKAKKGKIKEFWEGLPFAVWSGIAFVIPAAITVIFGQEFPTILGAVLGLTLIFVTTRLKLFVPKNIKRMQELQPPAEKMPLLKVVFPYILLIGLLIFGKIFLGAKSLAFIFGFKQSISLFNPGLAFILAGLPVAFMWGRKKSLSGEALKLAFKRTVEPFSVIACMAAMVQLMINSGHNLSGLPSSLDLMAQNLKTITLPFLAPIIGAFGSFLTGSVTISNIMFGNLFSIAGLSMHMNVGKILALLVVGAAAGNMVALADILSAEAVVGLRNHERQVLKGVIIPCAIYVLLTGLLGLLII